MPLVRSWWLGKKKGKEVVAPARRQSWTELVALISNRVGAEAEPNERGQGRKGATAGFVAPRSHPDQVHAQIGCEGEATEPALAIVAADNRKRLYSQASDEDTAAANCRRCMKPKTIRCGGRHV